MSSPAQRSSPTTTGPRPPRLLSWSSGATLAATVVTVVYVVAALRLPHKASLMPLVFGCITLGLLTIEVFRTVARSPADEPAAPRDHGVGAVVGAGEGETEAETEADAASNRPRARAARGVVLLSPLFAIVGGFIVGILLFLLLFYRFVMRLSWWRSGLLAVVIAAFAYFLFTRVLGVQVFDGFLGPLFGR